MRSVVRALGALTAVLFAVAGPLVTAVPSVQASVGKVVQQPASTTAASSPPLAISITGITPRTALPGSTVTVTGTLTNRTGAALPGLVVQASTSPQWFLYPQQMTDFTNGVSTSASPQLQPAGQQYQVPTSVPNGATVSWSVNFQAGAFYSQFGVFPLEVLVQSAYTSDTATARTFLPFWPGSNAVSQPTRLQVAWVWPLIDTPQQGACPQTLATSDLASSVASGGRLSTLLAAGAAWTGKDALTWNIDPALLSDVSVMTKSYFTQGQSDCTGRFVHPPSAAASAWLSQLKTSTAGAPTFLTPYANVDAAALSHAGLDSDAGGAASNILKAAYQLGGTVASQILPNTFGETGTGTGDGQVLKAAWPADGEADAGVLASLATDGGINTVVLSSNEPVSPASPGDALAKTISDVGTPMSVLLANSSITSLLGTASPSASAAGQFALTQDFLAQTAMIAAEYGTERSLVVAPPPSWDPSPAEANALLSMTSHQEAPWLQPTGLSTLATEAGKLPSTTSVPPKQVSGAELSDAYTDKLATVATNVSLFQNLLYKPSAYQLNQLNAALAVTASSDWRGQGSYGGWRAISLLNSYLNDAENKVQLVASKKILLFGQSGETAVSVQNGLGQPIRVQVTASPPAGSDLRVGSFNSLLTVQPRGSGTVHVPLHSATIGTTTVQLHLATATGMPLTWDEASQPLSIEVTRFGRSLLIIIGGALGILVLTSAYRLRRKRVAGAKGNDTADGTAKAGGSG